MATNLKEYVRLYDDAFDAPFCNNVIEQFHKSESTYLDSCLLYTSPSPRDWTISRMPSSA